MPKALQIVRGAFLLVAMGVWYGSLFAREGVQQLRYFSFVTGIELMITIGLVTTAWFEWLEAPDASYWRRISSVLVPLVVWGATYVVMARSLPLRADQYGLVTAIARSTLGGDSYASFQLLLKLAGTAIVFPITHRLLNPMFDAIEDLQRRPWVTLSTVLVVVSVIVGATSLVTAYATHFRGINPSVFLVTLLPVVIATWLSRNWSTPATFKRTLAIGGAVTAIVCHTIWLMTPARNPSMAPIAVATMMTIGVAALLASIAIAQLIEEAPFTVLIARFGENWLFAVMAWPVANRLVWSQKLGSIFNYFDARDVWRVFASAAITIGLTMLAPKVKSIARTAAQTFGNPFLK